MRARPVLDRLTRRQQNNLKWSIGSRIELGIDEHGNQVVDEKPAVQSPVAPTTFESLGGKLHSCESIHVGARIGADVSCDERTALWVETLLGQVAGAALFDGGRHAEAAQGSCELPSAKRSRDVFPLP